MFTIQPGLRSGGAWPLLALLLGACGLGGIGCGGDAGSGIGGRPSSGSVIGNTTAPECGSLRVACLAAGLDAPFAAGSTAELAISFELAGSSGPPVRLESTDPAVLSITGSASVEARAPGFTGLLFIGPNDSVLDFFHLWVARAEELRIVRYAAAGERLGQIRDAITLLVGDELLVAVEPYAHAQPMLGNFLLEHTVEPAGPVALVPDPVGGWYRLVARQPGATTVTFQALGLEQQVQVEVQP